MTKLPFFIALLLFAVSLAQVPGRKYEVDLDKIAEALRFPQSELTVQDVSENDRKVSGNAVLYSCRVTARTPYAFYPILITIAREGHFVSSDTKKALHAFDSIPEGPIGEGGRGQFGSLAFGANIVGGLLIGEIPAPPTRVPFSRPEYRMAVYSIANDDTKHLDIRIAMLAAFTDGKDLVKVPNGDDYFRWFSARTGVNGDARTPKGEFDHRQFFTVANEVVWNSPLVRSLSGAVDSTPHLQSNTSPASSAVAPIPPMGNAPIVQIAHQIQQRTFPVWLWGIVCGLILFLAAVFLRRRI